MKIEAPLSLLRTSLLDGFGWQWEDNQIEEQRLKETTGVKVG
jgi:hypothetical protein